MIKNFYRNISKPTNIDNNRQFDIVIRRVNLIHLLVIISQTACIVFLLAKVIKLTRLENVYVVMPNQTIVAQSAEETRERSNYEYHAFSKTVLEKAFANNRYSFDENIREVTELMDEPSSRVLVHKMMDAGLQHLYNEANGVSTVSLEELQIENMNGTPMVYLKYRHFVKFLSSGKDLYEDDEAEGGMLFEIHPIKRSFKNPYGIQIRNLKFLSPK